MELALTAVYKMELALTAVYKMELALTAVYKMELALTAVYKMELAVTAVYKMELAVTAVYKMQWQLYKSQLENSDWTCPGNPLTCSTSIVEDFYVPHMLLNSICVIILGSNFLSWPVITAETSTLVCVLPHLSCSVRSTKST